MVIVIEETILFEGSGCNWISKNFEVILIFQDRFYSFRLPDIDDHVPDHARVAARCHSSEWVGVIDIEVVG